MRMYREIPDGCYFVFNQNLYIKTNSYSFRRPNSTLCLMRKGLFATWVMPLESYNNEFNTSFTEDNRCH
jgi:hypothetical protein